MPIPEPTQTQDKTSFLQACMADETMTTEYPDSAQRYAICLAQWDNRSGSPARSVPRSTGWPSSPF
jgi:hypothetical protein